MTAMEKLVVDFELQLRDIVGKVMKRSTLNSARVAYGVEYLTNDGSGLILITSTNDDTLRIAFLKGKRSSMASEIYCSPDISNYSKAEQALAIIVSIIADGGYEGHNMSIEEYAECFKNSFVY